MTEQADWRLCNNCQVLFWNGSPNKGKCPNTDGGHVVAGKANYTLDGDTGPGGAIPAGAQDDWRWCENCMVLWWNGLDYQKGPCAATNSDHQPGNSWNFTLQSGPDSPGPILN